MTEQIRTLFRREFQNYFNTPIGYVFLTATLFFNVLFFFLGIGDQVPAFWAARIASIEGYAKLLPLTFILLVPAVTMRLWAEERRNGTLELLRTLPFTEWELVMGKLLAAWAYVGLVIAACLPLGLTIWMMGRLDLGASLAQLFGAFLMAGAYVSMGLLVSAFTREQIVAFVATFFFSLVFFLSNYYIVGQHLPLTVSRAVGFFSLSYHYNSFSRGLIDASDLVFYASFIGLMVTLNVLRLRRESRS